MVAPFTIGIKFALAWAYAKVNSRYSPTCVFPSLCAPGFLGYLEVVPALVCVTSLVHVSRSSCVPWLVSCTYRLLGKCMFVGLAVVGVTLRHNLFVFWNLSHPGIVCGNIQIIRILFWDRSDRVQDLPSLVTFLKWRQSRASLAHSVSHPCRCLRYLFSVNSNRCVRIQPRCHPSRILSIMLPS